MSKALSPKKASNSRITFAVVIPSEIGIADFQPRARVVETSSAVSAPGAAAAINQTVAKNQYESTSSY